MEDNKTIFDTVTLKSEPAEAESSSPVPETLEIFGEGDGVLSKDKSVKYVKPRAATMLIFALIGVLVGVIGTIAIISSRIGGLGNLRTIRQLGKYDVSVIPELLDGIETYHFGETPDSQTLIDKAAHSLVSAMGDPYASYFTKDEYENYTTSFNGNYYGIGVTVGNPDGTGSLIHRVYEGSFAEEAGLEAGDLIIAVDGKDIRNISSDDLVDLIKGDEGTTVDITFIRGEEEITTTVTRGEVYVKRVDAMMLDGGVGYIYLSSFSGNAVNEFKDALESFKEQDAKGLIVDLRDDPGGSLTIVVDICDLLLPKDAVICSMQGKTTDPTLYYKAKKEMYDFPLAVLVNGYSASASEIFAGAMQDNERGIIIGTQTYGKGVVQTTFPLTGDRGYLKLTTDAYYTPNGTNLGGTGITPDVTIELTEGYDAYDIYTLVTEHREFDTQLAAAMEKLAE